MGALQLRKVTTLSPQFVERFGGGMYVGIGKLEEFAATAEPNLIMLFSRPSCHMSQSSQPLLIFSPGPAGLAQVAEVTWSSFLLLQLELLCPAGMLWP